MRSSSPKRTHIIGRAELNSQTLVVILIIVEESNVNMGTIIVAALAKQLDPRVEVMMRDGGRSEGAQGSRG